MGEMGFSAAGRLVVVTSIVKMFACGGPELPSEAIELKPSEQAGLYAALARDVAGSAAEAAVASGTERATGFVVVDRPAVSLGSFDEPGLLERFDDQVLDSIADGFGGTFTFVAHPFDGVSAGTIMSP